MTISLIEKLQWHFCPQNPFKIVTLKHWQIKCPAIGLFQKSNQHEWPDDLYLNVRLPTNILNLMWFTQYPKNAYSEIHQFEFNIYLIIVFVFFC